MSEVRVNNLSNENNTGGPTISGITTYSGRHFFVPPQGDTVSRPSDCEPGSIRFNTDSAHLEYFRGDTIGWTEIEAELTAPLGGGTASNAGLGHRGTFTGGEPSISDNMDFITIPSRGNATDFGDYIINNATGNRGQVSSSTRGFCCGGESPSAGDSHNTIGKHEFASTGSAIDFANLTFTSKGGPGCSNATRGVVARGYGAPSLDHEDVCFFTMASQQDAVDFGDLLSGSSYGGNGMASSTRGIIIPSRAPSGFVNSIEFCTIATTGNFQDFGDAISANHTDFCMAAGNATRGVMAGGQDSPNTQTDISFITFASKGNAVKFGDLHTAHSYAASVSDPITMVIAGGQGSTDRMDAISILTGGTSVDFGNLTVSKTQMTGCSNGHGGL